MKGIKAGTLRDKTVAELEDELEKERAALFNVRRQIIFGQVKDFMSVKGHRKNIARILTVLTDKKREAI